MATARSIVSEDVYNAKQIQVVTSMGFSLYQIDKCIQKDENISTQELLDLLLMLEEYGETFLENYLKDKRRGKLIDEILDLTIQQNCRMCHDRRKNRMCSKCNYLLFCDMCVDLIKICPICCTHLQTSIKIFYG